MEGASSDPVTVPYVLFFFVFIILLIYLFVDIIHYHFQTISLDIIALMTANNAYPFQLMHSVVSRIYVPCLIISHLKLHTL